jgi:Trk K+ transport system NAD-binding subunit
VVIGDASSRRVLRRASLHRAVALVAAGSEERDNISVSIAAQAVVDDATIVIRAGADDAIDETRSLFRIGSVVDVNGLTSVFVVESMLATAPYAVIAVDDRVLAVREDGQLASLTMAGSARCTCA